MPENAMGLAHWWYDSRCTGGDVLYLEQLILGRACQATQQNVDGSSEVRSTIRLLHAAQQGKHKSCLHVQPRLGEAFCNGRLLGIPLGKS